MKWLPISELDSLQFSKWYSNFNKLTLQLKAKHKGNCKEYLLKLSLKMIILSSSLLIIILELNSWLKISFNFAT